MIRNTRAPAQRSNKCSWACKGPCCTSTADGRRLSTVLRRVAIERGRANRRRRLGNRTRTPRRADRPMRYGSLMDRCCAASAVILAGTPADVEPLAGLSGLVAGLPPPVRVATLDVALRSLPKPRRTVAFGVDAPLYFSVHSALARLAPDGGAVIHATKYLRPDETAGSRNRTRARRADGH